MTGNKFETADILSRKEPTESACERHRNRLPPLPAEAHLLFLVYPYKVTLTGTDRI